jgi:hypothetical protein
VKAVQRLLLLATLCWHCTRLNVAILSVMIKFQSVLSRGAEVLFTKAQREPGHMQHVTVGPMVLDFAT